MMSSLLLLNRHVGELEIIGVKETKTEGRSVGNCEALDGMGEWVGARGWMSRLGGGDFWL